MATRCAMIVDVRLWKQKLALGVCMVFLTSFTLTLLQRTNRGKTISEHQNRCRELSHLFTLRKPLDSTEFYKEAREQIDGIKNWSMKLEDKKILEYLLLTQECPWKPRTLAVARYREDLEQCCNASFQLVLTKENTPLGSDIVLDGVKNKKLRVTEQLIELLQEQSPFSETRYDHCAIVGNGGILHNSSCGKEIDQADFVIRFNLPPMNFSEDVGTKTNLVTLNPSILSTKYKNLEHRRKPFMDSLSPYGDAFFLIPSFSFVGHSSLGYRAMYSLEDFGLLKKGFFMNPQYMKLLGIYWAKKGFHPVRLSSGFMLVNMALELCQHITLYGFWPFPHDHANQPIPHHYYDNKLPKKGIHAMPSEFSHYLNMYSQGVLCIRLGKCRPERCWGMDHPTCA